VVHSAVNVARILRAMRSRLAGGPLTRPELGAAIAGLVLATLVRLILLPLPGLAGDLALFIGWARSIATSGLGQAYHQLLSFPPVLPWIWAGLGLLDPALRTADPNDPAIAVLMKLPATVADVGLAAVAAWWLRARPRLAIAGALAILLVPVTVYLSAWWGQFESIYVLPALLATVLALRGQRDLAAVAAAVALMTKPQALPLMVPLVAWFIATSGWRGSVRAGLVGGLTILVLWLPFLPSGGPASYLENLRHYADQEYGVISLRAWNPWWLAQVTVPGTDFVSDQIRLAGPVTFRVVGVALAAAGLLVVALRIVRRPSPEALLWGMAAAALVAFSTLTTMHERYSYPALIFLVFLWPNRLAVATWVVLAVAVTANVVAAVPPDGGPGTLIPLYGPLGAIGSVAITASAIASLVGLARATRRGTSGGTAAASAGG
jgi:hypothetical protein